MGDLLANRPETLPEALTRAATDHGDLGINIFDGRGRSSEHRTYRELVAGAREFAARVDAVGIGTREPVLVALPTSWEWLETWFGLLMRGAWPVASSAAGALAAADVQLAKVDAVMEAIGARYVIGNESFREQAAAQGREFAASSILTTTEIHKVTPTAGFSAPAAVSEDVAFLQLTSGSTGVPRAVMISHLGAIHNPLASVEAIGEPHGSPATDWADAMVSWLPLYHDMGLVGCLLLPIIAGFDLWLYRPPTFLARPNLWLDSLGTKGVTFTPAPNFAYQLCVDRVASKHREALDLSSWKAALCGAEMIRKETVDAFCEAFVPHGFDPRAFRPCYGLAEATLAVTFDVRGEGVRTRSAPAGADQGFALSEIVSNGRPLRDTEVRIVAPDGEALPGSGIGEVTIRGPGVFRGYFNDVEMTEAVLRDGWFATGDLGFLHDGELYLTGRIKDVLILRGHNMMPDEIERIADAVTGGGGLTRSAAFSIVRDASGEQAVLVVEIDPALQEHLSSIDREIRVRVGRLLGLPLADLAFVRRGRIPRTTSGKVQRREIRKRYIDGALDRLSDASSARG